METRARRFEAPIISGLLLALVLFDVGLTTWAFAAPEWWFRLYHGAAYVDPQALLKRCGANWAAFALIQALAWRNWRRQPAWLAVVAGVRLSDIFTDATCAVMAQSTTWAGYASFFVMSPVNALLGLYFWRAHREVQRRNASPS